MGAVLMTVLMIVVLAVAVVDSRDRVRRDVLTDNATLRTWYDRRYGRRGRELNRRNLEDALRQAHRMRRWGPLALSAGTVLVALVLIGMAASTVPGIGFDMRAPRLLLQAVEPEVLVQAAVVLLLLPVLVVEGILAALFTADLDISRLERLLESLN